MPENKSDPNVQRYASMGHDEIVNLFTYVLHMVGKLNLQAFWVIMIRFFGIHFLDPTRNLNLEFEIPSGKRLHNEPENNHFIYLLLGKLTIFIAIFNSEMLNYQRVLIDNFPTEHSNLKPWSIAIALIAQSACQFGAIKI